MNQAEFFEANQVDGNLTDEQAMQMLALPEGDSATTTAQSSDAPDAAQDDSTPEKVVATADTESDKQAPPVVLARDGVHTIPYEQLEDARRAAQYYKQQLELVQAQAQAPARTEPTPEQTQTQKDWISPEEVSKVMGDFSEDAIAKGVMTLVDKRAQSMLAEVDARAEAKAAERVRSELEARDLDAAQRSHFDAINKAHPDAESIADSQELRAWIGSQPSYAQAGIVQALQHGTAEQVIEALDAFKASTAAPRATTTPAAKPETLAAAKAAIAKAKAAPPLSLSAVPAGSHAAVDELAAISEMSDAQLLKKFGALDSPGKSMALLDRIPGL